MPRRVLRRARAQPSALMLNGDDDDVDLGDHHNNNNTTPVVPAAAQDDSLLCSPRAFDSFGFHVSFFVYDNNNIKSVSIINLSHFTRCSFSHGPLTAD